MWGKWILKRHSEETHYEQFWNKPHSWRSTIVCGNNRWWLFVFEKILWQKCFEYQLKDFWEVNWKTLYPCLNESPDCMKVLVHIDHKSKRFHWSINGLAVVQNQNLRFLSMKASFENFQIIEWILLNSEYETHHSLFSNKTTQGMEQPFHRKRSGYSRMDSKMLRRPKIGACDASLCSTSLYLLGYTGASKPLKMISQRRWAFLRSSVT